MSILAWIIVGLIGGAVAQLLVKDDPIGGGIGGFIVTILLGIAGALLGGFLAVALGISNGVDDFDVGTVLLAIAGSVLILVAYKAITRRGVLRT
jgi:uncharacterized membrane protein YeaQ/YmgE (transglycosylase-associated protein family)